MLPFLVISSQLASASRILRSRRTSCPTQLSSGALHHRLSRPNSFPFTLFCTLLHHAKCYPLSFLPNPNSLRKTPGVAYPTLCSVDGNSTDKRSPLTPFAATLAHPSRPVENPAALSPVFFTPAHVVRSKPFVCHSYKKSTGGGMRPMRRGGPGMEQILNSHVITSTDRFDASTPTANEPRRGRPVGNFLTC